MKLLMISGDRSILAGKRGAFWYTLEEFAKHWERIDVICPRGARSGERLADSAGLQANRYPLPARRSFPHVHFHPSPCGLWYQASWIVKKGKELIHAHGHQVMTVHDYPPFYNGIGARWLSRMTGVPHVLEVHHVVGYPRAGSLTEWIGRTLSRRYVPMAVRESAATRVVNAGMKELLASWGAPAEKIEVVPSLYLDAEKLRPDPSIEKKFDVVFCGRLVANKGLMEVLAAMQALPGVRLLVIGEGPEGARARTYVASKKLGERVMFAGWLGSQEEVIRAMQSAMILVMSSKSEGGPRVVFEAMACGMPVVATAVGAVPDVIEDGVNGVLTTGTAEDLVEKIRGLLADEGLRGRIGVEARKVAERFERKRLIEEYARFVQRHAVQGH